jgi:hypothetical protein
MKMATDKHLTQYMLLVSGLVLFLGLFIWFAHNDIIQVMISAVSSLLFITWGIVHHVSEERARKSVLIEYILLGIVVFFIVFTVLSIF